MNVLRRQWPGVNKHGGIARITRVNSDDTLSVSYIIGDNKEAAISTKVRQLLAVGRGYSKQLVYCIYPHNDCGSFIGSLIRRVVVCVSTHLASERTLRTKGERLVNTCFVVP